ncbi:MAG: hypothetical protein ACP6IP_01240 [Candidatus Njordarchaeia archaeon]
MINLKNGLSLIAILLSLILIFLPWIKVYLITSNYKVLLTYTVFSNELALNLELPIIVFMVFLLVVYVMREDAYYLLATILFNFIAIIMGIVSILFVSGYAKKLAINLAISKGEFPSVSIYIGESLFVLLIILILLIGQLIIEILE